MKNLFIGKDKIVGNNNSSLPHSGLLVMNIYLSPSDKIYLVPPRPQGGHSVLSSQGISLEAQGLVIFIRVSYDSFNPETYELKRQVICSVSGVPKNTPMFRA